MTIKDLINGPFFGMCIRCGSMYMFNTQEQYAKKFPDDHIYICISCIKKSNRINLCQS